MTAAGRSFESTTRHGKYLFAHLGDGRWLVFHFGMTGRFAAYRDRRTPPEYTLVLFHFEDGWNLAYVAPRKLGRVDLIGDPQEFVSGRGLGPDPLDDSFGREEFLEVLSSRRGMIKTALMDQKVLAGIGNVYADEILFQAGIHPETPVKALGQDDLEDLFRVLRRVLETAVRKGAEPDRLPSAWLTRDRREGRSCTRCRGTIRKTTVGGRSTYLCTVHQKKRSA